MKQIQGSQKLDIVNILRDKILNAVNEYVEEKSLKQSINTDIVVVERPKTTPGRLLNKCGHGACKGALSNPREIGELIRSRLREEEIIESVSLDGPGFLNITINLKFWNSLISEIISNKNLYGKFDFGQGRKANLEFVSANPTGPLHLGHVRGAVFGMLFPDYWSLLVSKSLGNIMSMMAAHKLVF